MTNCHSGLDSPLRLLVRVISVLRALERYVPFLNLISLKISSAFYIFFFNKPRCYGEKNVLCIASWLKIKRLDVLN